MDEFKFKPPWWLRNPHLQTIWPVLFRKTSQPLELSHERFELPDGDFVDLKWIGKGSKPIVLVLHGFEGNIESHYAKGMLQTIVNQGWRGLFMHFRGCSGEPNRLPRFYHSGETADVAYVVDILKKREKNIPMAAIGFSLGGNILLKWLGETGNKNPLDAAIAISVPFDLLKTSKKIASGFSRVYEKYLLNCVLQRLLLQFQIHPTTVPIESLAKINSMYEFDNQVTAPLNGFENADDYYAKSSSRKYLQNIQRPTLILQAKDDPFMTEDSIPNADEISSYVEMEVSENGGHVGFITGTYPWEIQYWLEKRVPLFLKNYFKN